MDDVGSGIVSTLETVEHPGVVGLAVIMFVPLLFYIHIVYGARLYGNQSG